MYVEIKLTSFQIFWLEKFQIHQSLTILIFCYLISCVGT